MAAAEVDRGREELNDACGRGSGGATACCCDCRGLAAAVRAGIGLVFGTALDADNAASAAKGCAQNGRSAPKPCGFDAEFDDDACGEAGTAKVEPVRGEDEIKVDVATSADFDPDADNSDNTCASGSASIIRSPHTMVSISGTGRNCVASFSAPSHWATSFSDGSVADMATICSD